MYFCLYKAGITDGEAMSLLDLAEAFSPKVENRSDKTVVIDLEGCERVAGSPDEAARRLHRLAEEQGLKIAIGVASNPDAAIHAAKGFTGITLIPESKEAEHLSGLSIEVLSPDLVGVDETKAEEIRETLFIWGIKTFGDLAALPAEGLSERLGPEGVKLQMLARGATRRPLVVWQRVVRFERTMQFEHPVDRVDQLLFAVNVVLGKLCEDLSLRGFATNELRIQFKLEDRTFHERVMTLPIPMRDRSVFSKLILLDVDAHPPEKAVTGLLIEAMPAKSRIVRRGLFVPLMPEPDKLEVTLARLEKLVGAQQAGAAELLDTHRPDAIRVRHFNLFKSSGRGKAGANREVNHKDVAGQMGFRQFRPALPARVQSVKGRPVRVTAVSRKGAALRRKPVIDGKVVRVAGPWRTEGDWWTEEAWSRDEWDVAIGDSDKRVSESKRGGCLCRIYKDLKSGRWFIEGAFD